jgi:hypothetical protein
LQKLDMEDSWFFEGNESGLPVCYNSVLDDCAGSDAIIVFAHDDVTIGDVFLREKLAETGLRHRRDRRQLAIQHQPGWPPDQVVSTTGQRMVGRSGA